MATEVRHTKRQKKITGKIEVEGFASALADIQSDSLVEMDKVAEILKECIRHAYLSWSYPGLFSKEGKNDPARNLVKAEVVFDKKRFKIFDYKIVTNEDDIEDDSYQISLEDAQAIKQSAKLGDEIKIPFDVTQLDKAFVRRVRQLFQAKIKEASKTNILSLYQSQLKGLIQGTVTRADANSYELNFGKAVGQLKDKSCIPGERFAVKDRVLVFLSEVSDKTVPPTLIVNRSSADFVVALLKQAIPELNNGTIKIRGISRQAGKRTKIFVESTIPNVDPVGACMGPEANRMRAITNELRGEKIDILKYYSNKALQIIEAMKPASVIGMTNNEDFFDPNVHFDEIEREKNYEYPVVTVMVQNGSQGIAIGSGGANVRLASRITHTSINIKQVDEALGDGQSYIMLPEIEKLTSEQIIAVTKEQLSLGQDDEIDEEIEKVTDEEITPIMPTVEKREIVDLDKLEHEEKAKEKKEKAKEKVKQDNKVEVETKEEKHESETEFIEIKNKPKVKLDELEHALDTKKAATPKKKSPSKKKKEEVEVVPSEVSKVEAMPIYTDEELANLENEEFDEYEDDSYIDEEYEDYQ